MKTVCDKFGALFILDEVGVVAIFFLLSPNFLLTGICSAAQVMSGMGRAYHITDVIYICIFKQ